MKDNFQFSIFNFQLFYRFLLWRDKHIKEKHFILIVSFLVGICTAAAAIVLKSIIHFIQHLLTGNFNQDGANYLYLLYPVIGILLAGLFVKYIVRDDIGHGVTKILPFPSGRAASSLIMLGLPLSPVPSPSVSADRSGQRHLLC